MIIREALKITGTIGSTTKMPGTTYGLPAWACQLGSKLRLIAGSVCSDCYAMKGFYMRGTVERSQERRLKAIEHPRWADAMVMQLDRLHSKMIRVDLGEVGVRLQRKGGSRYRDILSGWHRWHDSGDLQSVEHLMKICEIAARLPWVRFWLPTQERAILREYVDRNGYVPENLTIRVSLAMVDETKSSSPSWPTTSSVYTESAYRYELSPGAEAHICPAPQQGHACVECRACWSRDVKHVAYAKH